MRIRLKPLRDQTLVVTGATSGIGLAIARKAAAAGSRLVLASGNGEALDALVAEIEAAGGAAAHVVTDVSVEQEAQRIADLSVERFGGFDTWVNTSDLSIYGRLLDIGLEEHRRLFDTNYWSVAHGSLIAARYLRSHGGALINIGSIASDRAVALQGAYSASTHAVAGFTDALRMELEQAAAPVSVTLIRPHVTDAPHKDDAPGERPSTYLAQLVAEAVLHAAQHPIRDLVVGGGGRLMSFAGQFAPRLSGRFMEKGLGRTRRSGQPGGEDGATHGDYRQPVLQRGVYAETAKHPLIGTALMVGAGMLLWSLLRPPER